MASSLPIALLVVLLAAVSDAAAQGGTRHLELGVDGPGVYPLRIRPQDSTLLLLDAPLREGGVTVEGGRFEVVEVTGGGRVLVMLPSKRQRAGEVTRVRLDFQGTEAPGTVELLLEVSPEVEGGVVRVYRRARGAESLREELAEEQQRRKRAEEEVARLREGCAAPEGLTGVVRSEWVKGTGVPARDISEEIATGAEDALELRKAVAYRGNGRVVVELVLRNARGAETWAAAGVEWTDVGGAPLRGVRLTSVEPIAGGGTGTVYVEAEAPSALGRYRLRVWSGPRAVTLNEVRLP